MDRMGACTIHPLGQWNNDGSMLLIVAGDEREGGHLHAHTCVEIPDHHRSDRGLGG